MQLLNAFSLQMLDLSEYQNITIFPAKVWKESDGSWVVRLSDEHVIPLTALESRLGHQDIANILGCQVNRISSHLERGETALVAQVMGGRLPEGVTTLPEDVKIGFFFVKVN